VCSGWTLLLAILAFSLSLLGTFLVRSGVLTSVHSFAADPTRGLFILGFLIIVVGGALTLYAWRAPMLKSPAGFEGTAREAFLLYNNIFLVVAAGMVFVGTLAPLIADAMKITPISVVALSLKKKFPMLMLPRGVGRRRHSPRGSAGSSATSGASPVGLWRRFADRPCSVTASTAPASRSPDWHGARHLGHPVFTVDPIDRLRGAHVARAHHRHDAGAHRPGVGIVAISTVESYSVERMRHCTGETWPGRCLRFDSIKEIEA
jgi:hypothetical protein